MKTTSRHLALSFWSCSFVARKATLTICVKVGLVEGRLAKKWVSCESHLYSRLVSCFLRCGECCFEMATGMLGTSGGMLTCEASTVVAFQPQPPQAGDDCASKICSAPCLCLTTSSCLRFYKVVKAMQSVLDGTYRKARAPADAHKVEPK